MQLDFFRFVAHGRTCATLFRKADGFMRHVMRCDSSRAADMDAELNGRSQLIPPPVRTMTAPKAARPVKKPVMVDASVAVPTKIASSTIAQELKKVPSAQELKKIPSVKRLGRPPNADKIAAKLAVAKNDITDTTSTPPVVAVASDNEPKVLPASRAPKRAYNRKSTTPQKVLKVENNVDNTNIISELSKPMSLSDIDLSGEVRPSRVRKTPKWLEDNAFAY
ncbi:unnamed protein product [Cylicostephanus goldi]|uniref:Uncharacterized protein n=1 Tax=Cylicostephanus goldi TaxID=71465 RepID=A0A3P7M6X7_CYLGO|nr:unnamed protein product [Cylicostephanus goldi]